MKNIIVLSLMMFSTLISLCRAENIQLIGHQEAKLPIKAGSYYPQLPSDTLLSIRKASESSHDASEILKIHPYLTKANVAFRISISDHCYLFKNNNTLSGNLVVKVYWLGENNYLISKRSTSNNDTVNCTEKNTKGPYKYAYIRVEQDTIAYLDIRDSYRKELGLEKPGFLQENWQKVFEHWALELEESNRMMQGIKIVGNKPKVSDISAYIQFYNEMKRELVDGMTYVKSDSLKALSISDFSKKLSDKSGLRASDAKLWELLANYGKSSWSAWNLGDPLSQFNYGLLLWDGKGVKQSPVKAVEWFEKASNLGHAEATYKLAEIYEKGRRLSLGDYSPGLDSEDFNIKQDTNAAIKYYRKAAQNNHSKAQSKLGLLYSTGTGGVKKDIQEALKWHTKAAEQGMVQSQTFLGVAYVHGKVIAKDYRTAFKWFQKASKQGDGTAQFYLGQMYAVGLGVTPNMEYARLWLTKASKHTSIGSYGAEAKEALKLLDDYQNGRSTPATRSDNRLGEKLLAQFIISLFSDGSSPKSHNANSSSSSDGASRCLAEANARITHCWTVVDGLCDSIGCDYKYQCDFGYKGGPCERYHDSASAYSEEIYCDIKNPKNWSFNRQAVVNKICN